MTFTHALMFLVGVIVTTGVCAWIDIIRDWRMKMRWIRGQNLKPGMTVCCVRAGKHAQISAGGAPFTVQSISYPLAVLEVQQAAITLHEMVSGKQPAFFKRTIAVSIEGARFVLAGPDYVKATQQIGAPAEDEFPSSIGDVS